MVNRDRKRGNMKAEEIVLQVRSVYGNKNIYPVCHVANALIKFKDPKITFNSEDLKTMKSLGSLLMFKVFNVFNQ